MNEENNIFSLKEKSCIIKSDKNNEYKIIFSLNNNESINITLYSTKIIQYIKT